MIHREEEYRKADLIITVFREKTGYDPFYKADLRTKPHVEYRQMMMYLLRQFTDLSFSEIGMLWKTKNGEGKNHATVLYACNRMQNLIEVHDRKVIYMYSSCYKSIKEKLNLIDFDKKTVTDQISDLKKLNIKLINREIERKGQYERLVYQLRTIPNRYKKFLKNVEILHNAE